MKIVSVRGCGLIAVFCATVWGQGRGDRPVVAPRGLGEIRPHMWLRGSGPGHNESPQAAPGGVSVGGFYPSDITSAYGITPSMGGGSGVTIAIIDAYDSPNAEADLAVFSNQFGLPACSTANGCFTKVNEGGGTALPNRNTGWELEINLDVQWVHAVAPYAHILLVEASSANLGDLLAAVNTAKQKASVVSMSWGATESRSDTADDSVLVQDGVIFLASSGDTAAEVLWPASSPNVIAVGGTNLAASGGHLATPIVETAWSGAGGGCSLYEAQPAAQNTFVPSSCPNRGVPDVAADAGPNSAVAVYISLQGGWYSAYGTSLAVQIFAGFIGTVNGMRGQPLTSGLSDLYAGASGASSSTSSSTSTPVSTAPSSSAPGPRSPGPTAILADAVARRESAPGPSGPVSGPSSGGSSSGGSTSSPPSGGSTTSSLYALDYRDITSGSAGSFSAGAGWDFITGLGTPSAGSLAPFLVTKQ